MHEHLVELLHTAAALTTARHGKSYDRAGWDVVVRGWTDEQLIAMIGVVA